ncbi:MAG: phosphoglycerate kinase [Leptospiraceae bacterium]|nr:phosphoglycerate kinase [Leptospiraceae bacterium]MCP5511522.1 phosphoglycerate kinase [Leptospiraceae bacterium]
MNLTRIENIDVKSQRVFVRVDFDLRMENGKIAERSKLEKTLPTIELLSRKGARIVLGTHFGKQDARKDSKYSTRVLCDEFSELFGKPIQFTESQDFNELKNLSESLEDGQILFLENLNFFEGEWSDDEELAKKYASLADIFVNDAFAIAHQTLTSTTTLTKFLPSYPGTLFFREVESLSNLMNKPDKPFVAIIGGSTVSGKIKIMNSLLSRVNTFLIGGAMAYTFLKSRAVPVGSSVVEKDYEVLAHQFIDKAGIAGVDFQMPIDHIIADSFAAKAKNKSVDRMGILDGWIGMDIGPKTISAFEKIIKNAGTVFWSGPMGVIEFDRFSNGSTQIAKAIAKSNTKSFIGGEETVLAVYKAGVEGKITHLSTGGGASLEFLEGRVLPGIKALEGTNEL